MSDEPSATIPLGGERSGLRGHPVRTAAIVTAAVGVLALAAVMVAAITVLSALAHLMVLLLVAFAGGAAL